MNKEKKIRMLKKHLAFMILALDGYVSLFAILYQKFENVSQLSENEVRDCLKNKLEEINFNSLWIDELIDLFIETASWEIEIYFDDIDLEEKIRILHDISKIKEIIQNKEFQNSTMITIYIVKIIEDYGDLLGIDVIQSESIIFSRLDILITKLLPNDVLEYYIFLRGNNWITFPKMIMSLVSKIYTYQLMTDTNKKLLKDEEFDVVIERYDNNK